MNDESGERSPDSKAAEALIGRRQVTGGKERTLSDRAVASGDLPMNQAPTMRSLFSEIYRELTNLDSRIWQTLGALIRPGVLARLWTRRQYDGLLPPFRLYIIASTLFFLAGGGVMMSAEISNAMSRLLPDILFYDVKSDAIRNAIAGRMLGWVALIRMASLIPLALLVALMIRRGQARMAPAFVFSMNYFTVAFALAASLAVLSWLVFGYPIEMERKWVTFPTLAAERFLLLIWLALGLHHFLERSWTFSILFALILTLVDFVFMFMSFAIGFAIVAETVVGPSWR